MVRSQPSRTRTLQTLTRPHPRPGHRTRASRRGSPGHGRLRGHIPAAWARDPLGSAAAPAAARATGAPLSAPPPAPSRLRRSLCSSAHRARGRARGLARAARRARACALAFRRGRARAPAGYGAAARLSRKPGLGGSDWRPEPGRGRRLGSQQDLNAAYRRRGVGEGSRGRVGGPACARVERRGSRREGLRWRRAGRPREATSAEAD